MLPPTTSPASAEELLARCQGIAGLTLGELATLAGIHIPPDFKRHKGWTGQLIETWLGASAGSKPTQDFPELGIELKTIPINAAGEPLETTYACYAPLLIPPGTTWENCNVRNKLSKVLWMPVEGERQIPVAERRIAMPVMWTPSAQQDAALKQDWEEITEMIVLGEVERITARHGKVMQLRPKAADGSVLTDAFGPEGERIRTRPRGFYLRKEFTREILREAFG
ncbi:DNA mismatch repair endonuclease MutH [Alteromonas ponticola]|uniref:DNA mismatch repair protein MutH n=1 Tax=Alteromonas aquimaris TaxID=2998417 RepID=A0ABT3P998_9ALTE|nr:DNA mismatch repair endonuclease MutH [Alteromonas aquimaris]MCW8109323.1 DNA mismatch repair endonuclease MutH [Alteromonas aquimaris]